MPKEFSCNPARAPPQLKFNHGALFHFLIELPVQMKKTKKKVRLAAAKVQAWTRSRKVTLKNKEGEERWSNDKTDPSFI